MKKLPVRPLVSAVSQALTARAVALAFGMQPDAEVFNVAHTAAESFTDTVYAICATLPATYDQAGYTATNLTYTTIGGVSDFPTFGSKRPVSEFRPINGPVEKTKGTANYGGGTMTMKDVPADAGQVIAKAAEASPNHYSIKITYPDGELHFLDVLVCSWELSAGKEGAPLLRSAEIQLCKAPVVKAAT